MLNEEEKKKMIKKGTVLAVNSLIGVLLGGGTGAIIGAISSLDDGTISLAMDKIIGNSEGKTIEKDTTDNVNEA